MTALCIYHIICAAVHMFVYTYMSFFYSVPIKTNATTYICYNYCTEDHVRDLVQMNCIYIYVVSDQQSG